MSRTVHGKTIELDEDPGLAEGQDVQIILKAVRTQRLGVRASFERPMTPTGTTSWRRSIRTPNGIVAPRWRINDPPPGYYTLRGHE
jgi:hypothetical protein